MVAEAGPFPAVTAAFHKSAAPRGTGMSSSGAGGRDLAITFLVGNARGHEPGTWQRQLYSSTAREARVYFWKWRGRLSIQEPVEEGGSNKIIRFLPHIEPGAEV